VRHPIYLGYLLNQIGFLLASFSTWNLAVYAVLNVFQVGRMLEEERLLRADELYCRYTNEVRYRVVPGIF
jgi:protein-S-isoprenylcysteine O-methyltransferase Ste14